MAFGHHLSGTQKKNLRVAEMLRRGNTGGAVLWPVLGKGGWAGTPEMVEPSLLHEITDHCKFCSLLLQHAWTLLSLTYAYSKLVTLGEHVHAALWRGLTQGWQPFPWELIKNFSLLASLGTSCGLDPAWPCVPLIWTLTQWLSSQLDLGYYHELTGDLGFSLIVDTIAQFSSGERKRKKRHLLERLSWKS